MVNTGRSPVPSQHPTRTKEERLVAILERFERGVIGVRGSAVADREGLPIANGFREPFDLIAVAAMSTLAAQSSKTVFDHLKFRPPKAIVIEGEDAKVVVYKLGEGQASFIAVVRPEANIGLLKLEMEATARRLEEELGFSLPTAGHVEDVFLLSDAGLLVGNASRNPHHLKDRDIVAGMFTAVQAFVRDTFREKGGGSLEEMELAHLRVRILRGRWTTIAIVASGRLTEQYLGVALEMLEGWEERNAARLDPWDGDATSLEGVEILLDELLQRSPGVTVHSF